MVERCLASGEVEGVGRVEVHYRNFRGIAPYFRLSVERPNPKTGELMRNSRVKIPIGLLGAFASVLQEAAERATPEAIEELGAVGQRKADETPPVPAPTPRTIVEASKPPFEDERGTYLVAVVRTEGKLGVRLSIRYKRGRWYLPANFSWETADTLGADLRDIAKVARELG